MRHIKNIHITETQNATIQQGESLLKYWVIAFVAIACFTRSDHETVTHKQSDPSTLSLILEWF